MNTVLVLYSMHFVQTRHKNDCASHKNRPALLLCTLVPILFFAIYKQIKKVFFRQRPYRVECTGSLPSFSLPWFYVRFGRVRVCTLGTRVSALPSKKDLSGGEGLPSRPGPRGPRACAPLACASHRSFLCVGGTTLDDCNIGQNLFEGLNLLCASGKSRTSPDITNQKRSMRCDGNFLISYVAS